MPWVLVFIPPPKKKRKRKKILVTLSSLCNARKCLLCEKWKYREDNEIPRDWGTLQRSLGMPDAFHWTRRNNIIKLQCNNDLILVGFIFHRASNCVFVCVCVRVQIFGCKNNNQFNDSVAWTVVTSLTAAQVPFMVRWNTKQNKMGETKEMIKPHHMAHVAKLSDQSQRFYWGLEKQKIKI